MCYEKTPPLSIEGSRKVFEEMAKPPQDTPERRETEKRVRFMEEVAKRSGIDEPIGLKH
jgi:hypothetical protein